MSDLIYEIRKRADSTAYLLGDLITPVPANDHVYKCTAAGTSDSSQPAFNTGAGSTTTDGGVTWTECNPTGVTYTGPLTFEREFRYGDLTRRKRYAQPVDYSAGGDVYSYDKQPAGPREFREIIYERVSDADLARFLAFVDLVQGAQYNWLWTDENAVEHIVKLLSGDDIENTPIFSGYQSDIRLELLLIT